MEFEFSKKNRLNRSEKLATPLHSKLYLSWAESKITEFAPNPKTLNPDPLRIRFAIKFQNPEKILLRMELMLNTGTKCLEVAFILLRVAVF